MREQIKVSILGIGAVLALAACASPGPVSSIGGAPANLSAEFGSLVANASQPKICRQESVTGSRIQVREVCLTMAEMKENREHAADVLREMRMHRSLMPQQIERPPPSPTPRTP